MPSAKILEQKKAETAVLTEKIKNAKSGVLVNYTGITVEQDTALRAALRKAGVEYKVYKNTMTERACAEAGYAEMKEYLQGMTALATSANDEVAPAKILKEYADKIETFELLAGFIDGKTVDKQGVAALAEIPNKDTLVCKIMMGMQSPLYGLAYALQAIIDKSGEAPAEAESAPEAAE
ncbi:MAG: 50S ribosomal protein L10 [Firmicutes bacterium]|nr:50S ribosomal protein L10 [Bacillota bacterium]